MCSIFLFIATVADSWCRNENKNPYKSIGWSYSHKSSRLQTTWLHMKLFRMHNDWLKWLWFMHPVRISHLSLELWLLVSHFLFGTHNSPWDILVFRVYDKVPWFHDAILSFQTRVLVNRRYRYAVMHGRVTLPVLRYEPMLTLTSTTFDSWSNLHILHCDSPFWNWSNN